MSQKFNASLAIIFFLFSSINVEASSVTWEFSGSVTFVPQDLSNDFVVGQPILITYGFDDIAEPSHVYEYGNTYPLADFTIEIGSYMATKICQSCGGIMLASNSAYSSYNLITRYAYQSILEGSLVTEDRVPVSAWVGLSVDSNLGLQPLRQLTDPLNIGLFTSKGIELIFSNNYDGGGTYDTQKVKGSITAWNVVEPSPVPVPASAWLLLSGLGGLGFMSRKRKA